MYGKDTRITFFFRISFILYYSLTLHMHIALVIEQLFDCLNPVWFGYQRFVLCNCSGCVIQTRVDVSLCTYIYISTPAHMSPYIYIFIYTHKSLYISLYTCIYKFPYTHMETHTEMQTQDTHKHTYMCICTYTHTHVSVYIYMFIVCLYAYIYVAI